MAEISGLLEVAFDQPPERPLSPMATVIIDFAPARPVSPHLDIVADFAPSKPLSGTLDDAMNFTTQINGERVSGGLILCEKVTGSFILGEF